jgi:preprotein translocase subunit YajC
MLHLLLLFAADPPADPAQGPGGIGGALVSFMPVLFLLFMAYFLLVVLPGRQRREEKEREDMVKNLNKGDEVLTRAFIYATVVSVSDTKDEVVLKVDDGTRIRMTKGSIFRNITKEEEAAKAKAAKDKK